MKIIPARFMCEVCRAIYIDEFDALNCETQDNPVLLPKGTMFGDHRKSSEYKDITFAIAKPLQIGHSDRSLLWACRDNQYGDSLGKNFSEQHSGLSRYRLNPNHPTFKRMVDYLKRKKIRPLVWDGEKPVSLTEFKRRSR
jgi:hypothetical protein